MDYDKAFHKARSYLIHLQQIICSALNNLDQKERFATDSWRRNNKYTGVTCTIENGQVFEKGGVNFSCMAGDKLPQAALADKIKLADYEGDLAFSVCGLSLVIHPLNPYAPTAHMNIRFFIAYPEDREPLWWFGGGYDLTPCYGFIEDCRHWHQTARIACDSLAPEAYQRYKTWCDDYFYLPHRQEQRGIGGIFFDELQDYSFDRCYDFFTTLGDSFLTAYLPIIKRRCNTPYGQTQRDFQAIRRGRYVEFNLLHDRGTRFGIESGGRTESILVSMPPQAKWHYQYNARPDSEETKLTDYFLKPRNWLH